MAQDKRKIEFRTQGSVAYDPSFYVGEEQAARPAPAKKPRPRTRPQKQPVVRQRMAVSPLPLWGWRGRC